MPDPIASMNAGRGRRSVVDPPPTPLRPRRPRVVLIALPMFAVFAAFGAVVWLAYEDGSYGAPVGEPPLIKAAVTPIKLAPDDPGGRRIPDPGQVRELLTEPSATRPVERLLPPEEEPLMPAVRPVPGDSPGNPMLAERPDGPAAVAVGGPEITQLEPIEPATFRQRPAATDVIQTPVTAARPVEPPAEAAAALDALLDEVSSRADAKAVTAPEVDVAAIDPGALQATTVAPPRADPAATDVRPAIAVEPPAPTTPPARRQPTSTLPRLADIAPGEPITATGGAAGRTRPASRTEPPTVVVPRIEPAPNGANVAALDGSYRIQLAAVRAEADARRAWDLFLVDLGPVLQGLEPFIERADTSNGVFYRVQVGPFAVLEEAETLCEELKQRNASCFVVRR